MVGYLGILVGLFHKILFGGSVSRQKASVKVRVCERFAHFAYLLARFDRLLSFALSLFRSLACLLACFGRSLARSFARWVYLLTVLAWSFVRLLA